MKKIFILSTLLFTLPTLATATDIIPTGNSDNLMYYKIGGGSDFALPPVENTNSIDIGANGDLGAGYSCGAFNPALSIQNTFNNIKDSTDNVEQSLLNNATGSLMEIPMYFLAQANPTAYNLINNTLLGAHKKIDASVKSCELVKSEISHGQNPYQDWGTLSVGNQWKKSLSLTATGTKDINDVKKDADLNAGNSGVPWVQGNQSPLGGTTLYAGGKNQPPIQVVSDTAIAGYNAMLNRTGTLNNNDPAPKNSELGNQFPTPIDAKNWITSVVGDQTITTCNAAQDATCKNNQVGTSGRGLLPWITCTDATNPDCASSIRTHLANLVTNTTPTTQENLKAVSASGLVISPDVLASIRAMNNTQQAIIITKVSQEVATQKVIDKALTARDLLQIGSQVPVIANNKPAQVIIFRAISNLDKDIQSIAFESRIRKQMMSNTLSEILQARGNQQVEAANLPKVITPQPLMEKSALPARRDQIGD